jgi:hypothetical protein
MRKDFQKNHIAKKRMIQDKDQGVYVEDIITLKQRFKDGSRTKTSMLPRIAPDTSKSMGPKTYQARRNFEQSPTVGSHTFEKGQLTGGAASLGYPPFNIQQNTPGRTASSLTKGGIKSQLSTKDSTVGQYGIPPPGMSMRKNQTYTIDEANPARHTADMHRKKMHSISEMGAPVPRLDSRGASPGMKAATIATTAKSSSGQRDIKMNAALKDPIVFKGKGSIGSQDTYNDEQLPKIRSHMDDSGGQAV